MTSRVRLPLAGLLALACLLPAGPATATPSPDLPDAPGTQVVVVEARDWDATTATLTGYERADDGSWRIAIEPTRALLGANGLARGDRRRQGTGTTPTGTYAFVSAFGRDGDPGSGLPYRRIDRDDAWTYNPRVPATYNVFQDSPRPWRGYGRYVERLWGYGLQYDHVAVLDYNLPEGPIVRGEDGLNRAIETADTRRGGGIFLHVSNGTRTAGCIAVTKQRMREILRWLDPDDEPVIVIRVRRT